MEGTHEIRGGRCVPGPAGAQARLLVAGDTHGNLDWIATLAKLASRHGCSGILQLGDFGLWPDRRIARDTGAVVINNGWLSAVAAACARRGVWLRLVDGNHDAHPLAAEAYPAGPDGIAPIRDGLLDWATRGARWTWCGLDFGALGGAFSIDRELRTPGLSWWETETITDADVARLGSGRLDVLVCHDAPEGVSAWGIDTFRVTEDMVKADAASRENRSRVESARRATRPKLLIHGHYHRRYRQAMRNPPTMVEGLASDQEANGGSWGVLELPSLAFTDGSAIQAAKMRAIANGAA